MPNKMAVWGGVVEVCNYKTREFFTCFLLMIPVVNSGIDDKLRMDAYSTLSVYPIVHHTCQEAGVKCQGW